MDVNLEEGADCSRVEEKKKKKNDKVHALKAPLILIIFHRFPSRVIKRLTVGNKLLRKPLGKINKYKRINEQQTIN